MVEVLLVTELFIELRISIHCLPLPPENFKHFRYSRTHRWLLKAI